MIYDVASLNADIDALVAGGASKSIIGYTQLGREIPVVSKGSTQGAQVLIVATTHAREYITTPLVVEMMKNYNGIGGVWCVPMLNIDGALLCQQGIESVEDAGVRKFLLGVNGGSDDFTLWKANARAVDLNTNMNAKWGTGAQNVTYPSPANYIGEYPVSESENVALRQLVNELQPSVVLTYHTRGEVIYWGFECVKPYFDSALRLAQTTGYLLEESLSSAGGLKDWFTTTTFKLGLTIEVVNSNVPYPISFDVLPTIHNQNRGVLDVAVQIAQEIEADEMNVSEEE